MADNAQKTGSQRKRFVIFGLISLLALLLCIAIVVVFSLKLTTEGVYDLAEDTQVQSATELPQTPKATADYLKALLAKVNDDTRVFVNRYIDVGVDESSITFSGSEHELKALKFMKNTLLSSVDGIYPENYEGKFGDGYKDYPVFALGEDEYTDAVCTVGETNDKGETYNEDYHFITLTAKGAEFPPIEGTGVYKTFNLEESVAIANEIKETLSPFVTVDACEIVPAEFLIKAKANRSNDEISFVEFIRSYTASFTVTFVGEYAELGSRTLSFNYSVKEKYDYTWAGLRFEQAVMRIKQGDSVTLPVKAVMNDDSEYSIDFECSDNSVASIDEAGYITGNKSSETPVTVTARLKYLGHEYVSLCTVYVIVPVEEIKISNDKMTMAVGETGVLTASFKPKDATITEVVWISEDESIATVLANGRVTAQSPGTTKIIAVSQDGHFRDSCTVTVTE